MKVTIQYGEKGLDVTIPDDLDVTVARPVPQKPLDDPRTAISDAVDHPLKSQPLASIIRGIASRAGKGAPTACVVISDHTRPVPSRDILPPLLERIEAAGIRRGQITILVATGLHRGSTPEELRRMLGEDIVAGYAVVNHDSKDGARLANLGTSSRGTPVLINKAYAGSDLKVLTGYVDPHFFAGFAGGRKAIVPGIAGDATVMENHSARHIDHPNARFAMLAGNPIHEDALEIARHVGADFVLNVCLDEQHRIVKVAAGDMEAVHDDLVQFVRKTMVVDLDDYYDIVVANNGGYPLDLNLYQAVKSMILGEMAVKEGGTIVSANEMRDGFGSDEFEAIIKREADPRALIKKLVSKELVIEASWQVQTLARAATRAEILVASSMPESAFKDVKLGMKWVPGVEQAIVRAVEKHGKRARILVLPAGPQLIPCVKGSAEASCKAR
ncbi:MAG: nickel-dependent lactate racemase [Candidatus Lokiarchaeota archaeon]|nr:nickel-dependent lactate racemase [Candidatus Lokiarchaeota archaeon]